MLISENSSKPIKKSKIQDCTDCDFLRISRLSSENAVFVLRLARPGFSRQLTFCDLLYQILLFDYLCYSAVEFCSDVVMY